MVASSSNPYDTTTECMTLWWNLWCFEWQVSPLLIRVTEWLTKWMFEFRFPFWAPYSWNFRFGTFDQVATRWVKFENFDVERVFCFGTLYQWCVKFLSRIFYPFWPPYGQNFLFGTFDQGVTKNHVRYFRAWCDHFPISVLSTNGATSRGLNLQSMRDTHTYVYLIIILRLCSVIPSNSRIYSCHRNFHFLFNLR